MTRYKINLNKSRSDVSFRTWAHPHRAQALFFSLALFEVCCQNQAWALFKSKVTIHTCLGVKWCYRGTVVIRRKINRTKVIWSRTEVPKKVPNVNSYFETSILKVLKVQTRRSWELTIGVEVYGTTWIYKRIIVTRVSYLTIESKFVCVLRDYFYILGNGPFFR